MMYFIYDILLHMLVLISLPYFILKMITTRKYRDGISERFGFINKEKLKRLYGAPVVWVHAVSVGETKAVLPVIKLFKDRHPGVRIAFSTVTRTGNDTAAKEGAGVIDALMYFPLDLSWVVRRVIRKVSPKSFITVEKEIWPNIFRALHKGSVPVIIVNGTISDRSFRRFTRFGFFFKGVFGMISCFCARTDEDRDRAIMAGVRKENARTTGNVKFDLKPPLVDSAYLLSLQRALDLAPGAKVIVAGSTHPGEEEKILDAYQGLLSGFKGLKLILAPRHPERFSEVEGLIKKSGLNYSRRSDGTGGDVVLLDTVGELMVVYSFATVAFVGGSLVPGIGGHNLLEPAFFGKPVIYGRHLSAYGNMSDMLIEAGGGIKVKDEAEFSDSVRRLLQDDEFRAHTGRMAKQVVETNRGAAKRTAEIIEGYLPDKGRGKRTPTVVRLRK